MRSRKDNFGHIGNKTAKELGVSEMKLVLDSTFRHGSMEDEMSEVDWHLLEIKRKEESVDLVGVF